MTWRFFTHLARTEGASFQFTFAGIGIALLSDTQQAQGIIEILSFISNMDRFPQRVLSGFQRHLAQSGMGV